jgi:hypothetical protein
VCTVFGFAVALAACSTDPVLHGGWVRMEPAPSGGRTALVTGDWEDVYAAALVAAPTIESAILHREEDERRLVLTFTTIDDEPGELTAERLSDSLDRPGPIRITVRIGLFGNSAREERLIRAIADRLRGLAGRAWAPVS